MIENICDRAAWIDQGRVAALGSPQDVVKRYRYKVGQRQAGDAPPTRLPYRKRSVGSE